MRQDDVSATGLISAPLPFPALILFENRIRIQWLSRVRLVGSRCAISLETPDRRLFRSQRDTEAMNLTSASSPKVSKNKKAQNPLLSCFFNEIDKMLPSATRAFAPPPCLPGTWSASKFVLVDLRHRSRLNDCIHQRSAA